MEKRITLRLPLDLRCPACEHIGIWLIIDLPEGVESAEDYDGALIPVGMACGNPDCDREIDYGLRTAEVG